MLHAVQLARGSIPDKGSYQLLAETKPPSPHQDHSPPAISPLATSPYGSYTHTLVVTAGHTPCGTIAQDAVIVHLAYSLDVTARAGSSLHSTGRMLVRVAIKPPDKSLCRLKTAPPDPLSPSALPFRPRSLEEGAINLTGTHRRYTVVVHFPRTA